MKGIINQAIQEYVVHTRGDEAWWKIREETGIREVSFNPSRDYPDEWTARLLDHLSADSGRIKEDLLRDIGRFLVPHTLKRVYPTYIALAGNDVFSFLARVGLIHRKVVSCIPNAKPPSIEVLERGEDRMVVRYRSERRLFALFQGLLEGVGDLFDRPITVREIETNGDIGENECRFEVSLVRQPSPARSV
ncbi:MAG: heme NO-binding domain-containing protein [Candidatus Eisenbacteria bacterium]|nr:heme NO-binding domain-containing protein [Candidatus Eisenbacteria bacterium]